ncbi:hypothetical protein N7490_002057 [Penicillium lividum]|nr:hypothetical protein N7490_002057 [Penicillium lividum]
MKKFDNVGYSDPGRVGDASYTTSLTSSAFHYQMAGGTTRIMKENTFLYVLALVFSLDLSHFSLQPNDEQEQDRLDLSHHIYLMLSKGELCRAPIKNPKRVLDLGTGTGIWAMDFAEVAGTWYAVQYSGQFGTVLNDLGIDLSPIQPSWVPPNCRFEVDNFEQPWSYNQAFDFIHGRELEGAIRDHDVFFRDAFENLNSLGWLEMATMEPTTYSDDGTHLEATCLMEAIDHMHSGAKSFGKDLTSAVTWKDRMKMAGFINVQEIILKLPQSPWPKDPKLKELGRYHQLNMIEAMPAYTYALLTRMQGWDRAQIETLLAGIRKELKDTSLHLYTKVHIVYGQKPE